MKAFSVSSSFTSFSLLAYLTFILFAPILQVDFPNSKKILFYIALIFVPFTVAQPEFRNRLYFLSNGLLFFLFGYPIFVIGINLFFDTGGMAEISTFLSIYFVIAAITQPKLIRIFLQLFIVLNFVALLYEFLNSSYIYEDFYNMSGEAVRSISIASYGDVGFRAKGFFSGPLDATSFIIFSALIFRNRALFLYLCLASALLTNGRLAIIVCCILIIRSYKLSFKTLVYISLSVPAAIVFLSQFQESLALENLFSVFDLTSSSNTGRIFYTLSGVEYLLSVDVFGFLFGSSVNFLKYTNGHSAESGLVSIFVVHGFVGFIFLFVIFTGFSNRLKRRFLVLVLVFICLCVYRFDVGFMRSFFLYYILLYASGASFYDNNR